MLLLECNYLSVNIGESRSFGYKMVGGFDERTDATNVLISGMYVERPGESFSRQRSSCVSAAPGFESWTAIRSTRLSDDHNLPASACLVLQLDGLQLGD